MKIFLIFLLLGLVCLASFCFLHKNQEQYDHTYKQWNEPTKTQEQHENPKQEMGFIWATYVLPPKLELPEIHQDDIIITRTAYTLSYNGQHEQAEWLAYTLSISELRSKAKRKDNFRADSDIATGSAALSDYKNSGYDRGHLAPAADMSWSLKVMDESFYMSNISPQTPSFNRGMWKKLEEQVREWVKTDTLLYIVTGPVLSDGLETIGANKVSIPQYYYKIVADFSWPHIKTIAFLMPNKKLSGDIYQYTVSIDSIETVTGIDFFWILPDELEDGIEQNNDVGAWVR